MRKRIAGVVLLCTVLCLHVWAGTVSGEIKSATDKKNLSYASVLVKGTTVGVSANMMGKYSITLDPGQYVLVFQNVGFTSLEKTVEVGKTAVVLNVELEPRQYDLKEVVVKAGGEDPAYEIIRKTIARRTENLESNKRFTCEVYIKGQLQLRNYPSKFLGQKVDFEDGDSSKRKIIFLSETVAKYSRESSEKQKVEVLSTKVSGSSDGFGFSSPQIVSFYQNSLNFGRNLNPRGFISPIADNALNFYKYKFEGTVYEYGKEISRIRVTPKRPYEPLFSGVIHIIEDEWKLESVDLMLLKKQQLELLDTLVIRQQYIPAQGGWVIKNQVVYPAGKFFGFDFFGSFVQVYDKFNLNPSFDNKTFGSTVLKFYDSSNKKSIAYWDSIRPLPLQPEEIRDYKKKDSLEQLRKDPRYLDSLDRRRNKLHLSEVLLSGKTFTRQKNKSSLGFESLLRSLDYNAVEAAVFRFAPTFQKTYEGRTSLTITPLLRYGFGNRHFNPSIAVQYNFGKKYLQQFSVSGGRKVFQINNNNPSPERVNTAYSLFGQEYFMKIYEADFVDMDYSKGIGKGLSFKVGFQYQNRMPLSNLPDLAYWGKDKGKPITPNYPQELQAAPFARHQASLLSAGLTWRPGARYVEFPDRTVNLGSRYPTLSLGVTAGLKGLFGSDVDYTRWQFSASDQLSMNLLGRMSYRYTMGGFLHKNAVQTPDFIHYQGNQTLFASEYMQSFQLAPYYFYSNTATFTQAFHLEYHLNGFLTNKIPGFKKLNWYLVTGTNLLGIDDGRNYQEYFIGLENVFKILRVDFVQGFEKSGAKPTGFRISVPLAR